MGMPTIVKYIARKSPYNGYPERIVSPPSPAPCCVSQMEQVGGIEWENGVRSYRLAAESQKEDEVRRRWP